MDGNELRKKITEVFQKYRYALLILAAGIILMLLPTTGPEASSQPQPEQIQSQVLSEDFETKLSRILSQMEGAGKVVVFLSQASGEKTLYQTDEDFTSGDVRRETVLVTGADRAQEGLVLQINPPVYQGAVVLCQGADNAAVRLSITQAVANATGLGANQISVLKMK